MSFNKDAAVELNAKMLVLDDEPLVRLMVCSKLEQAGAWVAAVGSCAEALDLARKTKFDAAVFDCRLPDGHGLDVVRRLRAEGIGFPVVMLSGEAVDIETEAGEDLGICAVFPKPPDVAKIVAALAGRIGGLAVAKSTRVGRYAYWPFDPDQAEPWTQWAKEDWLAIDVSAGVPAEPSAALLECLRSPRRGVALVGANPALREQLEAQVPNMEFVAGVNELAALSRHPVSPSERAALMASVQCRG